MSQKENESHHQPVPSQFDIHEWSIMNDFCLQVEDADSKSQLLDAIHGSGAFRMFKSTISRLGMQQAWFHYRDEAIEQIAIDWLESENIAWKRTEG